jgi:hypothetical protein
MLSARGEFAIALALTCVLGQPARSWAQDRQVHEPTATETRGELPAALKDVPSGRVIVSYVDSKLTIRARNAPFIDVLREVCSQLGAELDAPSDADDPVLAVWGPGPTREVLGALLSHSRFDYSLAAAADDPNSLSFLAVFPRASDPKTKTRTADADPKPDADANSKPAPEVSTVVSGLRDLLADARASASPIELGQSAEAGEGGQQTADDAASVSQTLQADPATVLDQIEAHLKDFEAAAQSDPSAVPTNQTPTVSKIPPGRHRHGHH